MTIIRVSETELRDRFNAAEYYEKVQAGELLATLIARRPADPAYHQPQGTLSETWRYDATRGNRLEKVAIVHQFVLLDGTINNRSHRPDPKFLRTEAGIFALTRDPPRSQDQT
jgi:hypothetical protein